MLSFFKTVTPQKTMPHFFKSLPPKKALFLGIQPCHYKKKYMKFNDILYYILLVK